MRFQGQAQLGFFPLPPSEAVRLRRWLTFPDQFSAIDPCVGDGAAFTTLLEFSNGLRYGIEIDAHRSAQARNFGIEVLHANTLDVRCAAESVSLLYLNPPYDWEYGQGKNERLELIFLRHTYRWLKYEGVLVLIVPQPRMQPCARLLAEHFRDIRVYRLTASESVRFKQVAILAVRRRHHDRRSNFFEAARLISPQNAVRDAVSLMCKASGISLQIRRSCCLDRTHILNAVVT